MTFSRALSVLLLASSVRAGNRETAAPVVGTPVVPVPVVTGLPALDLKEVGPGAQIPAALPAAVPVLAPAAVDLAPQQVQASEPGPQARTPSIEAQAAEGQHRYDGAKLSAAGQLQAVEAAAGASAPAGGDLLSPEGVFDGAAAVSGLEAAGRNWYFNAIKDDPSAVETLKGRLDAHRLPVRALERRLLVDAALTGVEISKVVGVYRYGSSVWGHKNQPPGDMDVLVVVEGEAKRPSTQQREAMSVVSETDPKSFLMYGNEETPSQPGLLPLNVTVVSREYIRDFMKTRSAPEEARSIGVGDLTGDWGHGVLVYGEDALAAVKPSPAALVQGARDTVRNAGGFMENFIYKADMRKAQSMSAPRFGTVPKEENDKLVPKIYLRFLEAQLRAFTALAAQGKSDAEIGKILGDDPRRLYREFAAGRDFPELPAVPQSLVERTIRLNNDSFMSRVERADWSPERVRRERWAGILRGVAALALLVAIVPLLVGHGGWWTAALGALALTAGTAGWRLDRPIPAKLGTAAAAETVERAFAALDAGLADKPAARSYARRVLQVGRRRGFDQKPAVTFLVDRVMRGKPLDYRKDLYVAGNANVVGETLDVTIFAVHHDASRVPRFGGFKTGKDENPSAMSTAYSQVLYAVLKGASLKAAEDPKVKRVRIIAWRVMNDEVRKSLAGLGFTQLVESYPKDLPQAWTLEIPLEAAAAVPAT